MIGKPLDIHLIIKHDYNWASPRENLSSGFPTKRVLNQTLQLQRLAIKFTCSKFTYDTFQKANNKGAGLRLCYSQTQEDRFACVMAHTCTCINKIFDGAQCFSGRLLDSRLKGCGFEPHRQHCVFSLSKTY